MNKTKKTFIIFIILIMLITPYTDVWAAKFEGNASGTQLPSGGGGNGGAPNSAYNCVYILGLAENYGVYGLRVTFYLENGTQTGNTIDVWRWDSKASTKESYIGKKENGTDSNGFSKWKFDKKTRAINSLTKIDYLKIKDGTLEDVSFQVMKTSYTFYRDDLAPTYTTPITKVTDPLNYLRASDRSAFKEYFTTPEVVARYAKLAGANIDVQDGKYSILLEPMYSLSRMDCPNAKSDYTGRYTATELGILWEEKLAYTIDNNTLRKMIFTGLYLEKEATIGGYTFKLDPSFNVNNKINGVKYEHITGNYGYGMSIITGSEVCKENCTSGKKYRVIYRTFDLNNPFLNKDGTVRDLSEESNWYDKKDTIEADIYSKEPFLTVILDPTTIKEIRDDNNKINYSSLNSTTCSKFRTDYESIFSPSVDFCK